MGTCVASVPNRVRSSSLTPLQVVLGPELAATAAQLLGARRVRVYQVRGEGAFVSSLRAVMLTVA